MLLALLTSLALAKPPPADPALARVAWSLREVALHPDTATLARPGGQADRGLSVAVEPEGELQALVDLLRADGHRVEAVGAGVAQVFVPYDGILTLAATPGVRRVREPWRATPKSVFTEGYDATMAQDWHALGVSGAGVTVGIVDLGFAGWESLGPDEFPIDAQVNFQFEGSEDNSHGAEVAEILFDYAPDASYILGSFQTDAQLCEVMTAMVDLDVDVINLSVGFDNLWSTDGSSGITRCVDQIVEDGVAVFVAAGNEAERYRAGALSYADEDGTIAIANEPQVWIPTDDGAVDVRFRWSEPFGSAREDIDLYVYNRDGSLCGASEEAQAGTGDPLEQVIASGCKDRVYVVISSEAQGAELAGLEGWLYSVSGIDSEQQLGLSSLSLPSDTTLGVTVGAWSLADEEVAAYSSRGPTEDGRIKPDLVAPAGVSTETLGALGFEGTSAATPHAAGIGALWISASGAHGDAETMKGWMLAGARDLGEPGPDNVSGYGLVQADELPEEARRCGCATGASGGAWSLGLGLLLLGRRRKR